MLMCLYTGLGYYIPNLGQLFNLQGALTGTCLSFIFPITFYFKVFGDKISDVEKTVYTAILVIGVVGGSLSGMTALRALFFGKEDVF